MESNHDTRWRIFLLGELRATHGDRQIIRFASSGASGLLSFLAYHLYQDHLRDALAEELWPESDLLAARHSLCQALVTLRRLLEPPGVPGGSVILSSKTHLRLNPQCVLTDAQQFVALVRRAEREEDPLLRLRCLRGAADVYRGELLPGSMDTWAYLERDRLERTFARTVKGLIVHMEEQGDVEHALEYVLQAVRLAPLRESCYHQAMRLYRAEGREAEALRIQHRLWRSQGQEVPQPSAGLVHRTREGFQAEVRLSTRSGDLLENRAA